jgi:hypothetical protein
MSASQMTDRRGSWGACSSILPSSALPAAAASIAAAVAAALAAASNAPAAAAALPFRVKTDKGPLSL